MMGDLQWHDFDQKRHFKNTIVHPTLNFNWIITNNISVYFEDKQIEKCQSLSEKSSFCYKQKYLERLF